MCDVSAAISSRVTTFAHHSGPKQQTDRMTCASNNALPLSPPQLQSSLSIPLDGSFLLLRGWCAPLANDYSRVTQLGSGRLGLRLEASHPSVHTKKKDRSTNSAPLLCQKIPRNDDGRGGGGGGGQVPNREEMLQLQENIVVALSLLLLFLGGQHIKQAPTAQTRHIPEDETAAEVRPIRAGLVHQSLLTVIRG